MMCLKWFIRPSMLPYTSCFGGRLNRGSSTLTGPPGSWSRACKMMRTDWRISSIRTMYRSQVSPSSPTGTSKSKRSYTRYVSSLRRARGAPSAPRDGPAQKKVEAHLRGEGPRPHRPFDEDPVLGQQGVHVGDRGQDDVLDDPARLLLPSVGEIPGHPADPGVSRRQPRPRERLDEVHVHLLAGLPEVPEVGQRPPIAHVGADAYHVGEDPRELRDEHPDVLAPLGDVDPAELLDGHRVSDVVHQGGDVVQPVGVRHHLGPGVAIRLLLQAAGQVAELGGELEDRP